MKNVKSLSVKWSVSKAQNTYGYNICTVINDDNGERFKCLGGGYDMLGTSLANFIRKEYQTELMQSAEKAYSHYNNACEVEKVRNDKDGYYGMTAIYEKDLGLSKVTLDGGCGINSIERIINDVLGLTLERVYSRDRKGRVKNVIGFYLYPTEE